MMSEKSLAREWMEFLKKLQINQSLPAIALKEALTFTVDCVFIPPSSESIPILYIVSPSTGELTFIFQSGFALIFKLYSFMDEEIVRVDWGVKIL